MESIAQEILSDHKITLRELKQPGRSQPEAKLRHKPMVAMYNEGDGPTEIGDYFNRNKGSVMYASQEYGQE